MSEPSIKGTAFEAVWVDVNRLVEEGRFSRDDLEVRLTAEDLEILEAKPLPASWVPMETHRRLSELLMELEGRGDPQYVVERGRAAAERLFPIYQQLRRGEEIGSEMREEGADWRESDGRLMASISNALFNFSAWSFEAEDETSFRIIVTEAEGLPEIALYAAVGFIEYTASRVTGRPARVSYEREGPGEIVFTLSSER